MTRSAAPVPEPFTTSPDGKMVKCKVCAPHIPLEPKRWMLRGSMSTHLKTDSHRGHAHAGHTVSLEERVRMNEQQAEAERAQRDTQATALQNLPDFHMRSPAPREQSQQELGMWDEYEMNGGSFEIAEDPAELAEREGRQWLEREVGELSIWNAEAFAKAIGFGDTVNVDILEDDPEVDELLAEAMGNAREWTCQLSLRQGHMTRSTWLTFRYHFADVDEPETANHFGGTQGARKNNEFRPYDTKTMFLLDVLDNLPHLRISDSLMKVFLWILKECGANDVPSFYRLRKMQKSLCEHSGVPTLPCKSGQGNVFYINDPRTIIAKDWANPLVRKYIHVYPEITDGPISEIWHAEKWRKDMDLSALSQMWDDGNGVPEFTVKSILSGYPIAMPNPERTYARGRPIYTSLIDLFEQYCDFKKIIESTHSKPIETYDALTNDEVLVKLYQSSGPADNPMANEICGHMIGRANLPCRKCNVGGTHREKESDEVYHSMFTAGEPRTKGETLAEVVSQVELACLGVASHVETRQTASGVKDAYTQPWIEELINRARKMHQDEPNRTHESIKQELLAWVEENKDRVYNSFLTMKGFDPNRDTPVELLHTILLGIVKYVWYGSHSTWSEASKKTFAIRLQSTNTNGLSIHAIRSNYIMQYANSLIGRQLKTVAQTSVFHVYDLVSDKQFALWKAVGQLSALLWFPEIRDLNTYLVSVYHPYYHLLKLNASKPDRQEDVETAVANVLDLFAEIDPSKIIEKIKLHILAHVREDILRFGPLVGVATEFFECFNVIFRMCSILSNHRAPSRDIAYQLADQEAMKHRLTGGHWRSELVSDSGSAVWECAGPGVIDYLREKPLLQKLYGWTDPQPKAPGTFGLAPMTRGHGQHVRPSVNFGDTATSKALNAAAFSSISQWNPCKYIVARSGDQCIVGSWIVGESPIDNSSTIGRIVEVLSQGISAIVVIDVFHAASTRHPLFDMPMLARRQEETTYLILPGKAIQFEFNVQHDCHSAGCRANGVRPVVQERVESDLTETFIVHEGLARYVINTHAFHNAHLIRHILPRNLTAPIPLYDDRRKKHDELAATLRSSEDEKRRKKKEKEQQKQKEKEAKAAAAVPIHSSESGDPGATQDHGSRKKRKAK
ncbi:hypothetical protein HWV62_22016 [Athelia sp. TMB]|nr:hypothetical protein HWV62_26174 [Athelia sp. TMB]KAF7971134.1 hypothetical protein HWV62_22016 [Athelia sp. TMB]